MQGNEQNSSGVERAADSGAFLSWQWDQANLLWLEIKLLDVVWRNMHLHSIYGKMTLVSCHSNAQKPGRNLIIKHRGEILRNLDGWCCVLLFWFPRSAHGPSRIKSSNSWVEKKLRCTWRGSNWTWRATQRAGRYSEMGRTMTDAEGQIWNPGDYRVRTVTF